LVLTPRRLLDYFSKEELQYLLSIINEVQSGTRKELIERLLVEWPEHNKKWEKLLEYLEKSTLSQICRDYSIEHRGNRGQLVNRLKKELQGISTHKKIKTLKEEKSGEVHFHIGSIHVSKGGRNAIIIGVIGVIATVVGIILSV